MACLITADCTTTDVCSTANTCVAKGADDTTCAAIDTAKPTWYNSVIECVKVSNYIYWVKKRLVWACLKGVTL